jgi:hypothetical protein
VGGVERAGAGSSGAGAGAGRGGKRKHFEEVDHTMLIVVVIAFWEWL